MEIHNSQQEFLNTFLANTLHEIRTPIQTIISTLELLSETKLNDEQIEYLRQIQFSSDVLLSLANEVLDFSKIRSKQFKLENINYDVRLLTERVTDLICIEAFNKSLEVVIDISPEIPTFVTGDPTRIQQVLLNLLKNAVKFTKEGTIHCRLSIIKNSLLFEVKDTGIGITEETKKHLFTDFFQADASIARQYGGTGLGLSISKSLTVAMKGQIGAFSNPEGGSCFWFSIPLVVPEISNTKKSSLVTNQNINILIIDDNEIACKSMMQKIYQCGVQKCSIAYSGREAIAILENSVKNNNPFDAIFVDMLMPNMDGWYFASEVRTRVLATNTKMFLLVPEGQMGGEAKMKLLNWFSDYLYKPVKQEKLLKTLLEISDNVKPTHENLIETQITNTETQIVKGLFILVAEDHPVNRRLIVTFLEKFGAIVFQATDGNEAVSQLLEHPETDMIFMDIQMPNKNGIEATDEIRKLGYQGIVIACTANNDFATVDEYEKHGINDTLIKPFKSTNIKETIIKWQDFCIIPAELVPEDEVEELNNETNRELDVWDISDFEDTIGRNQELGLKLIEEFIVQTQSLIDECSSDIQDEDYSAIRRIGHTLKGSGASLSIFKFADTAEKMDIEAKKQNMKEIERYFSILTKDFLAFQQISKKWIKDQCLEH